MINARLVVKDKDINRGVSIDAPFRSKRKLQNFLKSLKETYKDGLIINITHEHKISTSNIQRKKQGGRKARKYGEPRP